MFQIMRLLELLVTPLFLLVSVCKDKSWSAFGRFCQVCNYCHERHHRKAELALAHPSLSHVDVKPAALNDPVRKVSVVSMEVIDSVK